MEKLIAELPRCEATFFFYPTDGLNIIDGVERVILCLGFYQWSSSSEGWPIGEPFSVIGEENTQYYLSFLLSKL